MIATSENGKPHDLTLEWKPNGHAGKGTITARSNGEPLTVDELNITKSKERERFASKLCDGLRGIAPADVLQKLTRIAADAASKPENGTSENHSINEPEIDVDRIVRPERFIAPEVSGLAVATMRAVMGKPVGQWLLYLRWADGRRECRRLGTHFLPLPGGDKLWFPRLPHEPSTTHQAGWSAGARRAWLNGAAAPKPEELFARLCERIAWFVDLPEEKAPGTTATLALWSMLTYCYSACNAIPYLYVGGPANSGKSRVFEVLSRVVFRPFTSSNLTVATLFRRLDNDGGVLLFDEAERLKQTNAPEVGEILSMLLAGYKRGGQATRCEPVGDKFRTVSFDVYGPKALACIAGLPPALASRCITLMMFRAADGSDKPRRGIDAEPAAWQSLRDDLHAMALEHGETWLRLAGRSDVCPRMSGRDYELWQPLLALAWWLESHGVRGLLALLQEHALSSIEQGRDDQTPEHDEILLRILADEIRMGGRPTAGEILAKAKAAEPETFKNWTERGAASHLKRFGLTTKKSCGRREYRAVTLEAMRLIQQTYSVDLGFSAPDEREP